MKKGKLSKADYGEYRVGEKSKANCKWKGKSVSAKTYDKKLKKALNGKKAKSFFDLKTISYSKISKKLK